MNWRSLVMAGGVLCLSACASYDGHPLKPGVSTQDEVRALMGPPSLTWQDEKGQQWAYPRGPAGVHTYMVYLGPDGRLQTLENVLTSTHFARIRPGIDGQEAVLRLIGPPFPPWTTYFKARDELVWEWRICDDWSKLARFGILFDGTTGIVRSTYQRPEPSAWNQSPPWCGR